MLACDWQPSQNDASPKKAQIIVETMQATFPQVCLDLYSWNASCRSPIMQLAPPMRFQRHLQPEGKVGRLDGFPYME